MTTTELVTIEQNAPLTLFGTDDPDAIIESATKKANALAGVIRSKKLYSNISGREYVKVEGWTLLGTMLGVFPVLAWSRPLSDGHGWEARVEACTLSGQIVGAAEAQCTDEEGNWSKRDDFALRSMAQTRATSKALRLPLGFIMALAGYDPTPAEEMVHDHPAPPQAARTANGTAKSEPIPIPTAAENAPISEWWAATRRAKLSRDFVLVECEKAYPGKEPVNLTEEERGVLLHALLDKA